MTPPNTRIYIIAEGQSEEAFINAVIKPAFEINQIYITPILIETSKGNKGGNITFERFQKFVQNKIKEDKTCFVSTMFDFYGLGDGFPCDEAQKQKDLEDKAKYIENRMLNSINSPKFIPYIQLHELEGLFFSDVEKLCTCEPNWHNALSELQKVREDFDTPEHINNSSKTAPSKRLDKILTNPKYRKTRHAPLIAKHITLDTMEKECTHFHQWLEKLRNLPIL